MTKTMKTEYGYVEKVNVESDGGFSVQKSDGWSLFVSAEEAAATGYVPKVGDDIDVTMYGFNDIAGIKIAGYTFRENSVADMERKRTEWLVAYEAKKELAYQENVEKWREAVKALHPTFQKRIARFEAEKGMKEFWKESGSYELYTLQGAQALINKATSEFPDNVEMQVAWVDWWWSLNTKEHNYNYKMQMAECPEFGDGHSGNTAGAATAYAKAVLNGSYSE